MSNTNKFIFRNSNNSQYVILSIIDKETVIVHNNNANLSNKAYLSNFKRHFSNKYIDETVYIYSPLTCKLFNIKYEEYK